MLWQIRFSTLHDINRRDYHVVLPEPDQQFFRQENTFIGTRRHRQQVCNTVLLYFAGERFYAKISKLPPCMPAIRTLSPMAITAST